MARTVNRYVIQSSGLTQLVVPAGSKPITAQVEQGYVYLYTWEPYAAPVVETLTVSAVTTWTVNHDDELSWSYIASVPRLDTMLLHVFRVWPFRKDPE